MTRDAEHTPSPQSVVVPVEPTEAMMVAADNAGGSFAGSDLSDHDMHRIIWYAMIVNAPRRAAPAPSSLAGGEVSRAVACVDQVARGAQVSEVYGGEWCLDPALEFRAHLRAILAALSTEAPALEGE